MTQIKRTVRGAGLEIVHRIRAWRALRRIEDKNPILVYQMGKVGSSTVVQTLRSLELSVPILHIHTLNPHHLEQAIAKVRNSGYPFLPYHLVVSSLLIRKLSRSRFPVRIITLTREPISRAISFVFEDWQRKAPDARMPDGTLDERALESAITTVFRGDNGNADPGIWFDRELRACFAVDVFATPYDFAKGFSIYRDQGIQVLIIRMEDLNRSLCPALAALLGLNTSEINLKTANEGKNSWYARTLKKVRESYHLPEALEHKILDTQYTRHFYTDVADAIRKRWVKSPAQDA